MTVIIVALIMQAWKEQFWYPEEYWQYQCERHLIADDPYDNGEWNETDK